MISVTVMTETFLDKAYSTGDDSRELYKNWSATYDEEVTGKGYVTPRRVAEALAQFCNDLSTPLLDYGCGTGLSGLAFRAAGFSTLHGIDVSAEMIEKAQEKEAYTTLRHFELENGPPVEAGAYSIIAAVGVIGSGAAPLSLFDNIMDLLAQNGLFSFSFNDHTLEDPSFEAKVTDYTSSGQARLLFKDYGDHLPGIGLKSNVYILKKL